MSKKTGSKLLSMVLALAMVLTLVPAAFAAGTDIAGHWAEAELQSFVESGYLAGDGTGNYYPNQSMTRAQFIAVLNRVLGLTAESDAITKYKDVSKSDWYYRDFAKALAAGIISGTSESTLSPNRTISRQETFVILARYMGLTAGDTSVLAAYSDAADIANYARGAMAAMVSKGYVQGSGGKLNPTEAISRAEGVSVLSRIAPELGAVQKLQDGVYTGSGAGYGGTITVQMTVAGGKITAIEIIKNSETAAYLRMAQKVIDSVLAAQTTAGVDAVSGATLSSKGILTAVEACISQAKDGEDTSKTGSTGSSHTGNSTKPEDEEFENLKDGVYEGSATGYSGTTKVQVTVSGGKISSIEILSHGDTTDYFNRATAVINQIIDAQGTEVDGVSGATYSVYGIVNAVANALKDAGESEAVTYEVASWKELSTALAKAQDGDTVKLTQNITDAGSIDGVSAATIVLNKAITLDGNDKTITAYEETVTNAAGEPVTATFCFSADGAAVTMQNLTIDGASFSAKLGGSIFVESSAVLTMEHVTIKNGRANSAIGGNGGAAVYVEPHGSGNSMLIASDCTFENNIVGGGETGRGGAIAAYSATVVLDGCTFSGNKAGYGGAVAAAGASSLTVTNCTFAECNDGKYGGDDIYIFDGYTFYKKTMAADSAVQYHLEDNTHAADGSDFTGYRVVMGRVLGDVRDTENGTAEKPIEKSGCVGNGNPVFPGHDLTFAAADNYERKNAPSETTADSYTFVLMNIPYADFYAAEVNNSVPVDAFTSATVNKTRTASLAGGSYHKITADNGSGVATAAEIRGVTFPVAVPSGITLSGTEIDDSTIVTYDVTNRGTTTTVTLNGREALMASDSYDYYALSAGEVPAYYKVLTEDGGTLQFGKACGVVQLVNGIDATFMTETSYGDYQLNLIGIGVEDENDPDSAVNYFDHDQNQIFGVILHTKQGADYGLRHLENIWLGTELAWSTGFTAAVHNCPTSSAHYEAIMGQTITGVTYYTDAGIFFFPLDEIYVPVKFDETSFAVADTTTAKGATTVTFPAIPGSYEKLYEVSAQGKAVDGFTLTGTKLSWTADIQPGTYTLTIRDKSGLNAAFSTSFILSSDVLAAAYHADEQKLVAADGAGDNALSAFLANISGVTVNGTQYAASGRGAVSIVNADGTLNLLAASQTGLIFAPSETAYTVSVAATGFTTPVTFTLTVSEVYAAINIPYADFYAAEVGDNAVAVDAVTTATTGKAANQGKGSYYTIDTEAKTTVFHGVAAFPVKIADAEAYAAVAALPKSSAVTYLSEVPSFYKEAGVENDELVYGTVQGKATAVDATATLSDSSSYGDYQLNVTGFTIPKQADNTEGYLYGAVVETEEGYGYALRHMENLWRGGSQLAWSTGFKLQEGHGCPLVPAHYVSMMGKTITGVTYFTSAGIYTVDFTDILVLQKFASNDFAVASAEYTAETAAITLPSAMPADYEAAYTVTLNRETVSGFAVEDGALTWSGAAALGNYTLTVKDENGKYASFSAGFTLYTTDMPAAYDAAEKALVMADGATEEAFNAYISAISAVSVDGSRYTTGGRGGVKIVNENGTINLDAASRNGNVFPGDGDYAIVIESTGYQSALSFTLHIGA